MHCIMGASCSALKDGSVVLRNKDYESLMIGRLLQQNLLSSVHSLDDVIPVILILF